MSQKPKQSSSDRHNEEYPLPSKELAPYMKHYGRTREEQKHLGLFIEGQEWRDISY